jgi:hypothetical protein
MLRRLRIAGSVFFGLLTLALLILWVRSIAPLDCVWEFYWHGHVLMVEFYSGVLFVAHSIQGTPVNMTAWWAQTNANREGLRAHGLPLKTFYLGLFSDGHILGIVPIWLPALTAALLATMPWMRRTPRFSLRTMLIATTVVAAALGLTVWANR